MMIKLAAFDLDGTLIGEDQQISPRVRRAIATAQERGVIVTLATGRMFSATRPFAEQLNIDVPLIAYQGGWIQASREPTPQYRVPLSLPAAQAALQLARSQAWHTILYADGQIFLQALQYERSFYESLLGENFEIVPSWDTVLESHTPDKVLFVDDPDKIPAMRDLLHAEMDGKARIFRSHAKFIEVVPLSVDKGSGLAWLAQSYGIPQEAVMAVGDQENDLPMIQWAGTGVAMGNAAPIVQQAANWVAPSLHEDGAAAALERFIA